MLPPFSKDRQSVVRILSVGTVSPELSPSLFVLLNVSGIVLPTPGKATERMF